MADISRTGRMGLRADFTSFLLILLALGFWGCQPVVHHVRHYSSGAMMETRSFLVREGVEIPHGVHLSWYADGSRKSMEIFRQGCREGFQAGWFPDGSLKFRREYSRCRPVETRE
jgi:hypothetical protein